MRQATRQKILLLLLSGVALGLSKSPKGYFKIIKSASKAWKEIERKRLYTLVREFYNDRLVDYKEDKDGFIKIVLTKEGQKKALKFKLDEMEIKTSGFDKNSLTLRKEKGGANGKFGKNSWHSSTNISFDIFFSNI